MTPGKLTAIGVAVVMGTALATGLVMAKWTGAGRRIDGERRPGSVAPAGRGEPTPATIEACNQEATRQMGSSLRDARHHEAYLACLRSRGY